MPVILLSNDLMFTSRAASVASQRGVALEVVGTPAAAIARCQETPASVIIVDLSLPGLEIQPLVSALRAAMHPPRTILAYGPHVHEGKLAAAAEAGCDQVLTRGQFSAQMAEILAGAAS